MAGGVLATGRRRCPAGTKTSRITIAVLGNKPGARPWRPDGLRTCVDCGLLKSRDDFVRIIECTEGYYGRCRVCRNRRARERYHSSAEIRAAEIARSSRNGARRRVEARATADWSPGGYVLGLLNARRAAGLNQRALAERAGLSPDTVGHLERADYPARPPTIKALATALGIAESELHVSVGRPHGQD
jgi:ribosome-binding protein aMBF1 (putative translation factor)